MDTTYYHLNARRLKVSGGADLLSVSCAPAPSAGGMPGQLLDFEACRNKLLFQEKADEPVEVLTPRKRSGGAKRRSLLSWGLETCATVCVILVSLSAIVLFLRA